MIDIDASHAGIDEADALGHQIALARLLSLAAIIVEIVFCIFELNEDQYQSIPHKPFAHRLVSGLDAIASPTCPKISLPRFKNSSIVDESRCLLALLREIILLRRAGGIVVFSIHIILSNFWVIASSASLLIVCNLLETLSYWFSIVFAIAHAHTACQPILTIGIDHARLCAVSCTFLTISHPIPCVLTIIKVIAHNITIARAKTSKSVNVLPTAFHTSLNNPPSSCVENKPALDKVDDVLVPFIAISPTNNPSHVLFD